ncbi:hypothetical protein F53441_14406 [Fusarium austroafricanum]|uniref:DDE-1 domain-containing protein n=1 Tax=Fusarium austroafricanum TaxID=2364996 RepID=A0A8H4JG24_9HYPO|nr:hypothetical protein F53441_14406 [Fusarium austroafricanum]
MAPNLATCRHALIHDMILTGYKNAVIARTANCMASSVRRIRANSTKAPPNGVGRRRLLSPPMLTALLDRLAVKPNLYRDEMVEFLEKEFETTIPASNIGRSLRWINPDTGNPNVTRFTEHNVETRTVAALELLQEGFYSSAVKAAKAWAVSYKRLLSRQKGKHPVSENGGNHTLFSPEEEKAILAWCWRRVTQGHHIQQRTLRQRKSSTLEAQRKAMEDRANVEEWFNKWKDYTDKGIDYDCLWNIDETGFQIGYLKIGIIIWTFHAVDRPILTDAHETISVTVVESISATGAIIPAFIIMPGVQVPSRWVDNSLEEGTTLTTTPKGYIDDIAALEFFDHFERHTRPQKNPQKKTILLDGCENHFTKEFFQKAQDTGVELFPFPPHLTHILQPLDVGLFSSYKHWHQEVLSREIADGATDFNKADFLFHLQEIRRKTAKKSTIISSWLKTGIYPFNPSVVIDRMINPLSSLSLEVAEESLPGYISQGSSSAHSSNHNSESNELPELQMPRDQYHSIPLDQEIRLMSTPPPRVNWIEMNTPPLKLRKIRQYEEYVALRIECSVASGTPVTPSVSHINEKLRKAHLSLALNGITATQEMRRLKEKNLRRSARDQGTTIIANYGPITVYDARLRVAKDVHNRLASQGAEELRYYNKEIKTEVSYLRRWIAEVRKQLRNSLKLLQVADLYSSQPSYSQKKKLFTVGDFHIKTQHQEFLKSTALLGLRYRLHRELYDKMKQSKEKARESLESGSQEVIKIFRFHWNPPFLLPFDYDFNIVKEALEFLIADEEKRRSNRKKMSLEADGLEIVEDDEEIEEDNEDNEDDDDLLIGDTIEVNQGEFADFKDEEDTE